MRKPRRPPTLTLVPTIMSAVKPSRKLGKYGADLWSKVTDEYDMSDAAGVEMLTQACQALDRAEDLRTQIDSDGEVIKTRAGLKAHPALRDELAARSFTCRILRQLGLSFEPLRTSAGRPPGG